MKFLESVLYRSVIQSREIKLKNNTKTAIKLGRRVNGKHQSTPWEDYGEDAAPAAEKKGKSKGRGKGREKGKPDKPSRPP